MITKKVPTQLLKLEMIFTQANFPKRPIPYINCVEDEGNPLIEDILKEVDKDGDSRFIPGIYKVAGFRYMDHSGLRGVTLSPAEFVKAGRPRTLELQETTEEYHPIVTDQKNSL